MIDATAEKLLTFRELIRLNMIPRRRGRRRLHVATLYRWATDVTRGVRLETLTTPGGLVTSREAVARFFEALTIAGNVTPDAPIRTPARRVRDEKRAAAVLDAAGVR